MHSGRAGDTKRNKAWALPLRNLKSEKGDRSLGGRRVLNESREEIWVLWLKSSRGYREEGTDIREKECEREKMDYDSYWVAYEGEGGDQGKKMINECHDLTGTWCVSVVIIIISSWRLLSTSTAWGTTPSPLYVWIHLFLATQQDWYCHSIHTSGEEVEVQGGK